MRTENSIDLVLNILERTSSREPCLNLLSDVLLLTYGGLENVQIRGNVAIHVTELRCCVLLGPDVARVNPLE